jgi:hypothetical protein
MNDLVLKYVLETQKDHKHQNTPGVTYVTLLTAEAASTTEYNFTKHTNK